MRLAILALAAALPALAAAPNPRSTAPLELAGRDALHRVALPPEAYRDARLDLADLRVLNAKGEPVPFAWAEPPEASREAPARVALPIFPIRRVPPAGELPSADITIRTGDGMLVDVRPKGGARGRPAPKPAAYVLDATAVKAPIAALILEWTAEPGAEVVPVRVEASDDLRAWRAVAASPVVRLEGAGGALTQPRIELAPRKAKYLRVTGQAPNFALTGVLAEKPATTRAPERQVRRVEAKPGDRAGELVWDLGAALPVEQVRLAPADTNAVVAASFFARNDAKAPWRPVGSGTFYRLAREGVTAESKPLDVGRQPARYWMARVAAGSSAGQPALEAHWRPASLVFVASGEGPFRLAFGDPAARPAALPLASVVPDYRRGDAWKLPEARVGDVTAGPPPTWYEAAAARLDPRQAILWAVLLAGVLVLGFLAWRMTRPGA